MRLLSMFIIVIMLLLSCASAEVNMADWNMRNSRGMDFRLSYNSEAQTYWAMTHVVRQLFGITITHSYRFYQFSENMTDVRLMFETPHSIYNIVATPNGVMYEREIFLVYTASEIYYYDAKTQTNMRCVPGRNVGGLYGEIDNAPVYYRNGGGVCLYDSSSNSEIALVDSNDNISCLIASEGGFIYKNKDGEGIALFLQPEKRIAIEYPDNISQVSNGYMLDEQNALLYTPDNTVIPVSFIEGADAISLRDGFLCSQHLSPDRTGRILSYISLDNPEEIIQIDIPLLIDRNINIQNGNAFFYTKQENKLMIVAVNLSSGATKTIILP